jgi:radical SAM superfamily enzyme YgiQ (UPF0313 family)
MSVRAKPGDQLPMQNFVPVGLLCLKHYAEAAGAQATIRVTELNGVINSGKIRNDERFYDALLDAVLEPGDSVVGLMTDADSLHHTVILAELIKQRSSDVLVCLGGPASTPLSQPLMERIPAIDFVVRGEGEETFVELLRAIELRRMPRDVLGLTWRDGDRIVMNPDRPVIENVDDLPLIEFEVSTAGPGASLYLDVGRGCPFLCRFCATAPFWSRRYRMKSTSRIVQEMTLARDLYGRRHVNFSHDIFTCDRRWAQSFCECLISRPIGVTWTCSTRTDVIDPALIELMAQAGCVEVYYGIESGSSQMQQQIKKDLDLDRSREIVRATRAAGIRPVTGFIVGYPMETMRTLGDTLEKFFGFLETGGHRAHLFTLCPFHQAPIFNEFQDTTTELGEYFDLPLAPGSARKAEGIRDANKKIFTSMYRFDTPNVSRALIHASEEISSRLVALKSLWPWLLPYYDSALEWYERWVKWIENRNTALYPGTRLMHQADVRDVLEFVTTECARLRIEGGTVADLLRYELLKLEAIDRLRPPFLEAASPAPDAIHENTLIVRRCDYMIEPFGYNLHSILAGKSAKSPPGASWVVFAKTTPASVDTIQVGPKAKAVLERANHAEPASRLIVDSDDLPIDMLEHLMIVRALVQRGLLTEAIA